MMALQYRSVEISEEQIANCRRLIAYLRTLPSDYPDFEMKTFVSGDGNSYAHVPVCGTAACAVGHGPAAGIAPLESGEWWADYSARAFVGCQPEDCDEENDWAWEWCFDSPWSQVDNTVHGAAARIEMMLDQGVPENWRQQMLGYEPLAYTAALPTA